MLTGAHLSFSAWQILLHQKVLHFQEEQSPPCCRSHAGVRPAFPHLGLSRATKQKAHKCKKAPEAAALPDTLLIFRLYQWINACSLSRVCYLAVIAAHLERNRFLIIKKEISKVFALGSTATETVHGRPSSSTRFSGNSACCPPTYRRVCAHSNHNKRKPQHYLCCSIVGGLRRW